MQYLILKKLINNSFVQEREIHAWTEIANKTDKKTKQQ